jgi:hypothetical protein
LRRICGNGHKKYLLPRRHKAGKEVEAPRGKQYDP